MPTFSTFANLSYANFHDYLVGTSGDFIYHSLGASQGSRYILCNLAQISLLVGLSRDGGDGGGGGSSTLTCACVRTDCCDADDIECINSDPDAEYDSASDSAKRQLADFSFLDTRGSTETYETKNTDPSTGQKVNIKWKAPSVGSLAYLFVTRACISWLITIATISTHLRMNSTKSTRSPCIKTPGHTTQIA